VTIDDQPNIADVLPEPEDGTYLARDESDAMTVIWRDDAEAKARSDHAEERWFDGRDHDPLSWPAILRYAVEVYAVPDEPLASVPEGRVTDG
jgi:hypothetical protein